MRRHRRNATVALVSVAVLGYSAFVLNQLLFGATVVAGIAASDAARRRGHTGEAAALAVLWGVLAGAAWTARLELILPAVAATALAYVGWNFLRGRGRNPASVGG